MDLSICLAQRGVLIEDDEFLIERCRHGDEKAFEELFQRYSQKIYSLAYRITANQQESEDILQNTFLRAYEHIIGCRKISNFYPWLCRVAINLTVDYHRSLHPNESTEGVENDIELSTNSVWGNPESELENKELGEYINAAIEELPIRQREVFTLKNLEGLSHKDIAIVLGCSEDAVRANLYQAVRKLREKLKKYLS
ncbi:sigma-70 family RNA polymerase sigma factor [Candidatus Poribacteria bacterium]|nr:sigma-70 family RNA polymerase sigma factor [Candidatus Poribacteria bacterium]